uniref:Uncharacterized protein n=1 Tax=Arundo donax TaxID=35708 RepID=A0A0A8XQ64_ARUDO
MIGWIVLVADRENCTGIAGIRSGACLLESECWISPRIGRASCDTFIRWYIWLVDGLRVIKEMEGYSLLNENIAACTHYIESA